MLTKSPLLIALACCYGAHLISGPVRDLSAGGGLILDGVGRLVNDTRIFVFEVLRGARTEIQEIYGGVHIDHVSTSSGGWCVDGAILIADQMAAGYLDADPQAPPQVLCLLRAAVSELARGTGRVRHLMKEFQRHE